MICLNQCISNVPWIWKIAIINHILRRTVMYGDCWWSFKFKTLWRGDHLEVNNCNGAGLIAYRRPGWLPRRLKDRAGLIWLSYQSMFLDWIAVDRLRGGGGDLGGPLVWSRIFWIMSWSVMSAIMRMEPPHRGQVAISILKTRRSRSAQVRGA